MKYSTFAEYDPRGLALAEPALLTVWSGIGSYHEELVLVGGLVPQYLCRHPASASALPRPGTLDVDLGIALGATAGQYGSLSADLKAQGFRPSEKFPTRFEKQIGIYPVYIDFLVERPPATQGTAMVDDIPANILPGIDRALATARLVTISGTDLFGAQQKLTVRVCEVGTFLVLKLRAFARRQQPKDAFDILYTLMHYDRGLTVVAALVGLGAASGQSLPPAPNPAKTVENVAAARNDEVVELNAFEVTAAKDNSYGALNSNSITSFRVDLNEIPVSADVFSKAFMDDIGVTNVEEMVQGYTAGAGLTSSNPSGNASSNQPGDRQPQSLSLRGLSTGATLRNGFFPATSSGVAYTSNFDIERVEVVSGPQSLLYGAGGGGGVVNYTSKQARFNAVPSGSLFLQVDKYGHKMGTIDYNMGSKRLAVRAVFTNQQIGSRRDFIGGNMVGGYVQLAARPVKNTTVRVEYESTSYTRIINRSYSLVGLSTANDARNGQTLHYLLATNQISAAANGAPSGAGPILNGNLNWDNIDSLGGSMLAEPRRLSFINGQVETVWTKWLSTKVAGGYTTVRSTKVGNVGVDLLAPNATANTDFPGQWAASLKTSTTTATDLWQPNRIKNLRASAVITKDLFGDRAHSQTIVGGDFTRSDSGGGGLGLFYVLADSNFAPVVSATPNNNNGYTNIGAVQWSLANGPIKYPVWGMVPTRVTVKGQNYVLTTTNGPVAGKYDQNTNPLSLSGLGSGSYRPSRKVEKGIYLANFTGWWENKLTTLMGVRFDNVDSLSFSENNGTNKLAIPSVATPTNGTGRDFSLGVNYAFRPWLRPYLAVSTAHAPPNGTAQDPYGQPQQSSDALGREAGLKIANRSGTVSGSVAYFRTNAKNEQIQFDVSLRDMINPGGLNGRLGIAPSNLISVDRISEGVHINVTANPTNNWRMRFAAGWQQARIDTGGSYPQLYNDQFNANAQGQVTYKDGALVMVDPTSKVPTVTAVGSTAGVPLTITMLSTPSTTAAPNPYYANPNANSGAINGSSGAAIVLQGLTSFNPTGGKTGTADPNIALHGPILTGAVGLPISKIQINTALAGLAALPGVIPVARAGERSQGSPQITFNYTSVYSFEEGFLKGLRIGGTYQGAWKRGVFYYYPDTIAKGPSNRALFRWPTQCIFNGILGYDWRWRRTKVSAQLNVSNLFNHYRILIIPALNGGYNAATGVDATFLDQPRSYTASVRFDF